MDNETLELLAAIEQLAAAEREAPAFDISPQYARDVDAVMALPENQSGAHRESFWRKYEFCRRHFARATAP